MLVHAHPDDETINNGVTMAHYVRKGHHVTLVTCTRGEEGEVLVPELSHLASGAEDKLGEHRVGELADAMAALGVTDFGFLGEGSVRYRDSGMMGTPPNERDDCFWKADLDSAASVLAKEMLAKKPDVLITYDEFGGYGHPDHIKAHQIAMRAAEMIRNEWEIRKIYWNTIPISVIEAGISAMKEVGSDFWEWRRQRTFLSLNRMS